MILPRTIKISVFSGCTLNLETALLIVALVIASIAFLVGWNVGYSSYKALLEDYNNLIDSTKTLQSKYDKLQEEYFTLNTAYETISGELSQLKSINEPTSESTVYTNYGWL